jgi:hypothetical protein
MGQLPYKSRNLGNMGQKPLIGVNINFCLYYMVSYSAAFINAKGDNFYSIIDINITHERL